MSRTLAIVKAYIVNGVGHSKGIPRVTEQRKYAGTSSIA